MATGLITAGCVLLGITLIFAGLLSIAKVKFHVEQDPRIGQIQDVLPSANCGGCGFAGCSDFARAVVEERSPVDGCPVGGPAVAAAVAGVLGVEVTQTAPYRPVVHCGAKTDQKLRRVPYEGVESCVEANVVGVTQACTYGCLSFGDCVKICNFGAMAMVDGLPKIDYDKCTGCGACSKVCPRNLVELIPFKQDRMLVIACANKEPGKNVKQVCKVGCIGCKICQKMFADQFEVKDNLAFLNYDNYDGNGEFEPIIQKCPAEVMIYFGKARLL